ncbi:MFS transporter [Chloroflexota bacterium]
MINTVLATSGQPRSGKIYYGYFVVALSLLMMVLLWGAYYSFGVFFKPMSAEFGWTRAMTSGAFSVSMFLLGFMGIASGLLTDKYGPRLVMTISGVITGLGYLLMSQIGAVWQFYLVYGMIIGTGMSGAWIPLLSTIARWFKLRRSLMTGIVLAGTGVGGLIGPPFSEWLISIYDWRKSFLIVGAVIVVIMAVMSQFLKRDPAASGQLPYGQSAREGSTLRFESDGLTAFESLKTRQFWLIFFGVIGLGFSMYASMVHISPHATDLGFSSSFAAILISVIGGAQLLGRVALGNVADRIGNKKAYIIGFVMMTVSLLWLLPAGQVWLLVLFALVYGFGQGGAGVQESPLLAKYFGLRTHGLIMGIAGVGFSIGGSLGPRVTGYIFDITNSYRLAFIACVMFSLAGLILTALLTPIKNK